MANFKCCNFTSKVVSNRTMMQVNYVYDSGC